MRYRQNNYNNQQGDYAHYVVDAESPLLEFLLRTVNESRSKIKATLQGRGIKVDGKTVTQFDYPLHPGAKISVSLRTGIVSEQDGMKENQLDVQMACVEPSKQLNLSFIKMKSKIANELFAKLSYIGIINAEKMDMF